MTALVLYPLLTAALYYLGARAEITRFLWSRYPDWLDKLTACPSCSGFWYGCLVAALGGQAGLSLLGLPIDGWRAVLAVPVVGLASLVWTPIVARHMVASADYLGGEGYAPGEELQRPVLGGPPGSGEAPDL